ncbi:YihY/virulence factor BrkB family protein [Helicovermis profundi]|uniref:YihY family inner membrane protein n=1 Tax=Helicovermis profundi TaxID=3065157 RepID=A0AAU9EEA3_9FIRM|nr:YihY family inner membrane protein [Clostridia bacterium S502]
MDYFKKLFKFSLALSKKYKEHHITAFSAQMAYFFTLSIFPFLIVIISLFGKLSMKYYFKLDFIFNVVPKEASEIIRNYISDLFLVNTTTLVPLTIIFALWSASKGVNSLMRSLNIAYDVKETRSFIKIKLLGMAYTAMISISLVIAIVIPSIGKSVLDIFESILEIPNFLLVIIKWSFYIVSINFVISSLYVLLPNKKVTFKSVMPGTIFAILGWFIISKGFSLFATNFHNFSLIYGSLTAIIILMIWLYISSMILMVGGEINAIDFKKEFMEIK